MFAGALGSGATLDQRRRGAADRAGVEPLSGRGHAGAADAVQVRKGRGAHAEQSEGRRADATRARAAAKTQRHHHAERAAFHHQPFRHSRHRSGQARAGDPRHGQAAAGIHRRCADALPDGDAQAFRRMRRQQRADVLAGADPGAAAGAARPGVLRGMDRRAGVDAARRGRRRSEGDVDAGGGCRFARGQPQRAAEEGLRRRHRRALPERRAHHARQRLPDAAAAARLRRQHEHEIFAPAEGRRSAGHDLLRVAQLLAAVARRQGLQVLLRQRGEILHHPAVVRLRHEGAGLLRDFRHRLFGHRAHRESLGLRRRRQELGRSGGGRPGQPESVHALSHAVALGRPAGDLRPAAPGTIPAPCSRCAPISSPCAARPRKCRTCSAFPTSTTTASRRGESQSTGEIKHVYV